MYPKKQNEPPSWIPPDSSLLLTQKYFSISKPNGKSASPETEPKAKKAKQILLKIESGEISAATSTLTWINDLRQIL